MTGLLWGPYSSFHLLGNKGVQGADDIHSSEIPLDATFPPTSSRLIGKWDGHFWLFMRVVVELLQWVGKGVEIHMHKQPQDLCK